MNARRRLAALVGIVLVAAAGSCAPRSARVDLTPAAPVFGVYKARLQEGGGAGGSQRFRLLLFAAAPDRLHAEVLTPLGTPRWILDGGDGELSVTFVPDGVSFVGRVDVEAVRRVLGIEIALGDLVTGLLGEPADGGGYRIAHAGAPGQLPERFAVQSGAVRLELELRRLRPIAADPARLGTGRPPDGTRIRDLDELGTVVEPLAGPETAPP